jgi:hypothetical protein
MRKTRQKKIRINFPQDIIIHVIWTDDVLYYINTELRKKWPALPGRADDGGLDGIHICAYGPYPNQHWLVLEHGMDGATSLHEIVHCVDRMMQWFGFEDSEFRAYMQELIFKKINE